MINGAHVIISSKDADADRAFLRDLLDLPHVDVGHGWLMTAKGIQCAEIDELSWGRLARITLPGGGEVGIYEPKHERPPGKA